ncbi:MAG: hypothetical protein LAT84_00805 [Balneolia bacterium]|nr:hypothetical protein [Balneolia bacterium]
MSTFMSVALNLVLLYAFMQFILLYRKHGQQLFLWYGLSAVFYLLTTFDWFLADNGIISSDFIDNVNPFGWTRVAGVSFLLVALGIENWLDRPQLLRFPFIFTLIPILLIVSFIFIFETTYLNEIILGIYEGGAILVAMLLFGFFLSKDGKYLVVVAGLSILLLGFIVYWFPGEVVTTNSWIWKLILASGVGTFVYGYAIFVAAEAGSGNDQQPAAVEP